METFLIKFPDGVIYETKRGEKKPRQKMAVQNCMFNALLNLNSLNRKIANSISFDERNNCILRFNKIDIRLTFIDPFLYVYSQVYGGLDKVTSM